MGWFTKKEKDKTHFQKAEVGDYIISRLIKKMQISQNEFVGNRITESSIIKGVIEEKSERSIKINGEWYLVEFKAGCIQIDDVIK